MTITHTLEPVEGLKSALQEFVDLAQPDGGVAYLLNRVDNGFYVPIACSKQDVLTAIPYYLLFSRLPTHKIEDGVCYPIEDSVKGWLESGRIESIVFADMATPISQQFTHFTDKHRHSLVLVRSAPSHVAPLPSKTQDLCKPLLSLVFSRWASSSYEGRLSAIGLRQGSVVELAKVAGNLIQILDDRDPFPPYWPFSYFSLRVESGDSKLPPQIRTNALGLARWSLKKLSTSADKPWIQKMASISSPTWEDIQEVAKENTDYRQALQALEKSDATAKLLIERLKDWIVPVCSLGDWKFYARHNKSKECNKHEFPLPSKISPPHNSRSAVAAILKHSEHACESNEADKAGDFLVTLWALQVSKDQNVSDDVLIGGRVAKDFSYLIEGSEAHDVLPEGKSPYQSKNSKSLFEIRYAPIPEHDAESISKELSKVAEKVLPILDLVDPKANLKRLLLDIFQLHRDWKEFFERPDLQRYHHPCEWMKDNHGDFDALIPEVEKVLKLLAPILKIPETEIALLSAISCDAKKRWCLNVAKALNHRRISPELLLLVAGRRFASWPEAYEIIGDHERLGSDNEVALEVATAILYGVSLLTRPKADPFHLIEFSKRDELLLNGKGDSKPVLLMRFESDFKEADIPQIISSVFRASESAEALKGKCRLLDKHCLAFNAGFTNRDSVVGDQAGLKSSFTLLFEFRLQPVEGKPSK